MKSQPDVILIATGSEVKLAVSAGEELKNKYGIKSRIVSMPSTTIFDQQSRDYKEKVVPNQVPKMIIEAGVTDYWWKYKPDVVLGIDKFGESAPEEDVFEAFGISSRTIVDSVLCLLGNDRNNLRGSMTVKVAINGFGRIGRAVLRANFELEPAKRKIQIVAINDLASPEANAHLTEFDSTHGRFGKVINVFEDAIK